MSRKPEILHTAWLYSRTLPHLRPWQVAGRVAARIRQHVGWTRLPEAPETLRPAKRAHTPFPQHAPWNTREALLEGRFTFLNYTEDLGWPIDWKAAHTPLLWRFNLHYFHYLDLLSAEDQETFCRSWIQANPVGEGVGWHPYPTALRIVNWCRVGVQKQDLLKNLYQQAAYLYRNLETYVYGNHLLENARALVLAGCYLNRQGEAERWLEKGLAVYRQETKEQILPDAGHYERSPMYHALMLEGYLDVLNVLPAAHPDRLWLKATARRMADVLVSLVHPDGNYALFNDATQEIAPPPAVLTVYVQEMLDYTPEPQVALPEMGYFIHRDDDLYLVIDGGAVGPDYLMAHAHADIFGFELSVADVPFIVDSGVYEYPAGSMRSYVRSTAAHNTVSVDGQDQVECWGSFRVARRAAPHGVRFEQTNEGSQFLGTFSGYAQLIGDGIEHRRRITVDRQQRVITVKDQVEGLGTHRIESRIHLHPEVVVSQQGSEVCLQHKGAACRLAIDQGPLKWEEGWYCPRFGVREKQKVAVLGGDSPLPVELSYQIYY